MLLSRRIAGTFDDDYFSVLVEHMQDLQNHRQFNESYASMISVKNIVPRNFDTDACFFTQVEKTNLFIKPKGKYLCAFCQRAWDKLPFTYQRMIAFAEEQDLTLKGYSYEEGVNEIAINSMDEYISQIQILCK